LLFIDAVNKEIKKKEAITIGDIHIFGANAVKCRVPLMAKANC
jgi:hypothetical protein